MAWWKRLLKESRPVRAGRAAAPLRVEQLETREVPTVGITLVNGQLRVTGNGDADVITLDHTGATTFVNGFSFPDASITGNIRINAGAGNDTVNVLATVKAVLVNGQGGFDTVKVGKSDSVQALLAPLTVTNQGGQTSLDLVDLADPVARQVTLAVNATGLGSVTGLAPAAVRYRASDVGSVLVSGGSGGNVFHVANTAANTHNPATVIVTGAGADTINVRRTTGVCFLQSGGAATTVNVGLAGSVQGIRGEVFLQGVTGSITLNVDDHADGVGRAVTMADLDVNPDIFTIAGLAPGKIRYIDATLRSLLVRGGSGGDTFTVADTGSGGLATQLFTGAGADTVHVRRTTSFLFIDGQGGADKVNVGLDGITQPIRGTLVVADSGHNMALSVDDHADATARAAALTTSAGTPAITGLSPATIAYRAGEISSLTVRGGSAGNTFTVTAAAAALTTLNTGAGPDTVRVEQTGGALKVNGQGGFDSVTAGQGGSLQALRGALTVTNATGVTSLSLDDSADAAARSVTLSVNAATGVVTGLAPAAIRYQASDLIALGVKGGGGGNAFTVNDTAANGHGLLTTIESGNGADTVNVRRAAGRLSVEGNVGFDKVNVGSSGSVRGVLGDLFVGNSNGSTTLTLDDHADAAARAVTIQDGGGSFTSIAGLAKGQFQFRTSAVGTLTLNAGGGGNTFDLASGPAVTILRCGAGADTVNVRRSSGLVFIAGQGGADKVNVGSAGSVAEVKGTLIVSNTGHKTTLSVDGHADTAAQAVTLAANGGAGTIVGLAPGVISYTSADVRSLILTGGSGGNTFTVAAATAAATTLNTGGGNDTVQVQRTTGTLTVHGQSGLDQVNVGQGGSAQAIRGALSVDNSSAFTALTVDDSADPAARAVTLDVKGGFGTITGLAPATISYKTKDTRSVTLSGGAGGNRYFVRAAALGAPVTVNAGGGNDTITVGSTSNTLDAVAGLLIVNGGAGADVLVINDQGSTAPHTYLQTPTSVTRSGGSTPAAAINFFAVDVLQLHKGPTAFAAPRPVNDLDTIFRLLGEGELDLAALSV